MNVNTDTNYLTNSLVAAKQFAGRVLNRMGQGIERTPWGTYKSNYGAASNVAKQVIKDPATAVAATGLDALTNATRRHTWNYTNMHRMMGDVGQYVGPRLGLESTLAGATAAAAVPVVLGALSGQIGSPLEGLRPKGYKAVAPVSKEEDPSGRKTRSPLLEATMRYALGQRSQLLPYPEFRQERPDVLPSTYSQYRRYEGMKPEPGQNIRIDPESQSFSALGGVIRGTARGLNDPEIRIKNVPVTLSAALGTAAGLGAVKALSHAVTPKLKIEQAQPDVQGVYDLSKGQYPGFAKVKISNEQGLGVKIAEKLGGYTDPALLAAGAITAVAVAKTAKKLFQKAEERKIKRENPVEYLKYKHGSLEQARANLQQPGARSWQELAPYVM